MNGAVHVLCLCNKVKEEASPSLSDTVHVDSSGLVTLTTPSRQHTLSVRAFPLPLGKLNTPQIHFRMVFGLVVHI